MLCIIINSEEGRYRLEFIGFYIVNALQGISAPEPVSGPLSSMIIPQSLRWVGAGWEARAGAGRGRGTGSLPQGKEPPGQGGGKASNYIQMGFREI